MGPPSSLTDLLTVEFYAAHFIGSTRLSRTKFLFHIQLGLDLDMQLKKLGLHNKCSGHIQDTPSACALTILAHLWTENVSIQLTGVGDKCIVELKNVAAWIEGLIHFAEAIEWPYLDQARRHIVGLLDEVRSPTGGMHACLWDWVFGWKTGLGSNVVIWCR